VFRGFAMKGVSDRRYMRAALRVARLGMGRTHPNPRVGALAVREGRVLGVGAHLAYGGAHAEAALIERLGAAGLRGATLYVTLEPCDHQGKTPPCTEAILRARPARVVVAMEDPHPLVRGRGLARLRRGGIAVESGICRAAALRLNAPFLWAQTRGRAFLTLKVACGLDGRLAAADGSSRWISSPRSRSEVHRWRAESDAILIGMGTLERDRPRLTARPPADPLHRLRSRLQAPPWPPAPVRVVVDSESRAGEREDLLEHLGTTEGGRWIIACGKGASTAARKRLAKRGVRCWVLPREDGSSRVSLAALAERCASEGLLDVMVEGGGALATALIRDRLIDRLRIFVAPRLLGGDRGWLVDPGWGSMVDGWQLEPERIRRFASDVLVEALSPDARGWIEDAGGGTGTSGSRQEESAGVHGDH